MIRTALAYLFVAAIILAAISSVSDATEYQPTKTYFASFSAINLKGHREYFVVPFAAWNQLECDNGTGPLKAVSDWIAKHPDWSWPKDIHCARTGEADL